MTSRINIARPQVNQGYPVSGGYSPDPHGFGNNSGRPSSGFRDATAADPDSPLEKLRAYSKQVEDAIEIYSQPLKPHLPAIGRFLIVVTFLEDSWRIMTQWSDQIWYLERYVGATFGEERGKVLTECWIRHTDIENSLGASRTHSC